MSALPDSLSLSFSPSLSPPPPPEYSDCSRRVSAAAAAAAAAGGEEGEVRGVTLIFRAFDFGGLARARARARERRRTATVCTRRPTR